MNNQATQERIAKLPLWAREHIAELERARQSAVDALAKYVNENDEGPFVFSEFVSDGEKCGPTTYTRRVNAYKLDVAHADIHFSLTLADEDAIKIRWSAGKASHSMGDVCFIPESWQQARLVHPNRATIR